MAHELNTKPSARNNFDNRVYRRVRFWSCGTVGYGPTMWVKSRKGDDVLHDHVSMACQRITGHLCWQQRWYQGRGTRRTIFLLVERGRTIGKVLVHRWLPEYHQQKQHGLTDRIVHGGVYISKRILPLRSYRSQERLNKTMERKRWSSDQIEQWNGKYVYTPISGVYPSQGQTEHDIHNRI